MIVAASRRTVPGVEVAGDDDADRLHPARHVRDARQPAVGEKLVVVAAAGLGPRRLPPGILDPEKVEPFVVLVVTSGNRSEIVPAAAGEPRRRTEFGLRAATASATSASGGAPTGLRLGPFRGRFRGGAGTRCRTLPVAPPTTAASARFSLAAGRRPRRSGGPTVSGGQRLILRAVIATRHGSRLIACLLGGRSILTGAFPAAATAATATATTPAAPSRLLVAGVATRNAIVRGAVAGHVVGRLAGLEIDPAPSVIVLLGPPRRDAVGGLASGPVDRRIPIKTGRGGRLISPWGLRPVAAPVAAAFAVTIAARATVGVVGASRRGRPPLLAGRFLARVAFREAELIVGAVVASVARRRAAIEPRRGALGARCVVSIPSAASAPSAASPTAATASRFAGAAITFDAISVAAAPLERFTVVA